MDKALFKRLVRGLGLPVVDWREVRAARWAAEPAGVLGELEAFAAGDRRPAADGQAGPPRVSSVGMTLAHAPASAAAALDLAFRYDTLAVVERYLAGARDLEVSVIGNDRGALELYGPGEIVAGHEFYDYAAKYTPGLSETSTRAEVPAAMRATILKIARDAYRAIGAEGFARVDFLVVGDGHLPVARSTRSRASPRSASSRRCPPRPASTSRRSASGSSTWPSSTTPRGSPAGSNRATCPGERHDERPGRPPIARPRAARRPGSVAARPA